MYPRQSFRFRNWSSHLHRRLKTKEGTLLHKGRQETKTGGTLGGLNVGVDEQQLTRVALQEAEEPTNPNFHEPLKNNGLRVLRPPRSENCLAAQSG